MSEYRLSDLLDLTIIQKMADAHYRAAGMPIGLIDAIDGSILVGAGWQDICTKFHRADSVLLQRCRESDNYIKDHLVEGEACRYKCKNGLWDIGVPIVVAGRHLATLFLGQFFYAEEAPDREFFIQQAREYSLDIVEYLAALDRVPVFSREKVDYILEYDKALASFIADLAENSILKAKADETIRENERKFHAVFDQAFQFLGLLTIEGRLVETNRTALTFGGVEETDVIGKPFWETAWWAHSPELQEKLRLSVQQAAKGEFIRFEATHPAVDGSLHHIDFSLKPVTDETGKVVLLIPEGRDITERKRTEKALHESQTLLRAVIKASPDPIFIKDLKGRYLLGNPAVLRVWGKSLEDVIGKKDCELYKDPAIADAVTANDRMVMESGMSHAMEEVIETQEGIKIYLSTKTPYLNRDGEIMGIIGIARDITDRKQAEEELHKHRDNLEVLVQERTIELEEKNEQLKEEIAEREKAEKETRKVEAQLAQAQRIEAIDRFAGGIAHDLNNILYPIIMNVEELLAEESNNPARHEILDETLKAAHRQRDLVKKILSFSRRGEQVRRPVRVKPLLKEVITFLKSSLPSTIEIRQSVKVKNDTVMGDPIQIQQIIINLCQNAGDAYPSEKGVIEVGLTNIQMKSPHGPHFIQAGDYLKLEVKDSGTGMPHRVMDRIFEPFFTSKGVGKGTGMGLSVVYGIVKNHEGTITVESEEGKGSLFTVYLPTTEEHCQDQAAHTDRDPSVQHKGKLLVIDDEELVLLSLQRVLKSSGYQVAACRDSREAFELFAMKPAEFDLVITDLTMPGMTGLDLSRKIQNVRPDIPIILCTGFNDVISQEEAKSFGIKELLLKPVGAGELKKVIHRALEN